jgi:hypothetical protein
MKMYWNNLVRLGTTALTASSAQSTLPVTNLQNAHRDAVWQSLGTSSTEWIVSDFGAALKASSVVLFAHNLLEAESVTIQLSNTADFSVIDYTARMQWSHKALVAIFPERSFRYCRVNITKSVSTKLAQVGVLFIGECVVPIEAPDFAGVKWQVNDLSSNQKTLNGKLFSDVRPSYRSWTLPFTDVRAAQADKLCEMYVENGTHEPFFLQIQDAVDGVQSNADIRDEVLYVIFQKLTEQSITGSDDTLLFQYNMQLEEYL